MAIPFWRAGVGEGVVRYTSPAGGIAAGTIIRYQDSVIPALPSSGTGMWDMYAIDSTTGAMTLSTSSSNGYDSANT